MKTPQKATHERLVQAGIKIQFFDIFFLFEKKTIIQQPIRFVRAHHQKMCVIFAVGNMALELISLLPVATAFEVAALTLIGSDEHVSAEWREKNCKKKVPPSWQTSEKRRRGQSKLAAS